MEFKIMPMEIKDINEEERSFWAVGSDETRDRDNDVIRAAGWKLDNFLKNPVIPWGHDYRSPPVAQATEIRVKNKRLEFKPKFPSAEEYSFGNTIWNLYKGGYLRAFSVGFNPIRAETVDWDEKEGKTSRGRDFLECELWEISACVVPSNPNALISAKEAGIINDEIEKKLMGELLQVNEVNQRLIMLEDSIKNIIAQIEERKGSATSQIITEPQEIVIAEKPELPVMTISFLEAIGKKMKKEIIEQFPGLIKQTLREEVKRQIDFHRGKV